MRIKPPIRISFKEQLLLFKQLSFLLRAQISLPESIHILQSHSRTKRIAELLRLVLEDLEQGTYVHVSLAKHSKSFSITTLSIIRSGELSGMLRENIEYISLELEKHNAMRHKLISSLMYPVCIAVATLGLSGFLILYIFPKIKPLFAGLRIQLPLSTRILISASDFIATRWIFIMVAAVGFVISIRAIYRTRTGIRYRVHASMLKLPIISTIIKTKETAHIVRNIAVKLKAHIPISDALDEDTGNMVYARMLLIAKQKILAGKTLSQTFSTHAWLFPDATIQLIETAERSGTLPETLLYISEQLEQEFERILKTFASLTEPALMLCMGLAVGFISLSIILPIYEISQTIRR